MTNPIIDAIDWDVQNTSASARLLQSQLTALQAEWDTKLSRFLQITSINSKSLASFQSLPNHRSDPIDSYQGLNPATPEADYALRYVRGQLESVLPYAGIGHKERLYLEQTAVKVPNASPLTTYLYQETVTLPRPAYVRGVHPVIVKGSGANGCNTVFRPLIDGSPVFPGTYDADTNVTGIGLFPLVVSTESYFAVIWSTLEPIDAGQHDIEMDLIASTPTGADSPANVAPFFNLYTSAVEAGTMPTTYVQPPVSYLEFIYT